jgi:hypothetical protein
MACETMYVPGLTPAQRKAEVKTALDKLEARIKSDTVKIKVDKKTGALAFVGWDDKDRRGVTDACAFRRIKNSPEVRMKVLRAEAVAGTKVNEKVIASGVHSHDGKTWHKGH